MTKKNADICSECFWGIDEYTKGDNDSLIVRKCCRVLETIGIKERILREKMRANSPTVSCKQSVSLSCGPVGKYYCDVEHPNRHAPVVSESHISEKSLLRASRKMVEKVKE